MKAETKKLTRLIQLTLAPNTVIPVLPAEILKAIDEFDAALQKFILEAPGPAAIKRGTEKACFTIAGLIYQVNMGPPSAKPYTKPLMILYNKTILYASSCRPCGIGAANIKLLPFHNLSACVIQVIKKLQNDFENHTVYNMLQEEADILSKTKQLPYHRWLWWSWFVHYVANITIPYQTSYLENLLMRLNFNTPAYCLHLLNRFKKELEEKTTAERISLLKNGLLQYKLAIPGHKLSYFPAAHSVSRYLINALKTELFSAAVPPVISAVEAKAGIQTSLTVPQLAFFIRLLIDNKILNASNQADIIRKTASVFSTARSASISFDGLRVNYYNIDNAAKSIIKNHLINMLNSIRQY